MSILVTGGSGFIGRRVVRNLVGRREEVVVADVQAFPEKDIQDKVKTAVVDVTQFSDAIKVIHDFEVDKIIHLALPRIPVRAPGNNFLHPAGEISCIDTANVFEAARIFSISRVVQASSIAVYSPQEFYGERAPTEQDPLGPQTVYGTYKVLCEFLAANYEHLYGVEIRCLRIGSVCGAGRESGLTGWVGKLATNLPQGKPVFATTRSDDPTPLISVDNIAELLVRLCLAKSLRYRIYNSGGHCVTAAQIAEIAKKRFPDADIRFDESAPLLPFIHRFDGSRIAEEFNWKISDLETTVWC